MKQSKDTKQNTNTASNKALNAKELKADLSESPAEVVKEAATIKVEKKKFKPSDLIPCTNVFSGTTVMIGQKSGIMYTWRELGQTEDVEYQDVMAEILKKTSSYIYEPLIIIEDKELLEQRHDLKAFYDRMYSPSELTDIMRMSSPEQMRSTITSLPRGVQESIKNIAATMIQNGSLDSVKKIKIIDEIFDTRLMMQTELFLK